MRIGEIITLFSYFKENLNDLSIITCRIVVDDGLAKKKLVGGVMTDDRVANVKRITNDTLNKMHK